MTQSEIETFFIYHNEPHFEKIHNAVTEDEAVKIAFRELDKLRSVSFDVRDLRNAVKTIRSGSLST